jgi:hypothetical protein
VLVLRHVAGGVVVDQLVKQENVKPAAEAAWSIGTSLMVSIATTIIVVGAFFAAAGWLSSPTGSARGARRVIAPALDRYLPYCYGGLAVILGIYLLSASGVGLRTFLTVVVLGVMAAFGLRELSKQTAEEFPGLTYDEVLAPTRKKIATAVADANLGERASKLKRPEVKRPGGMSLPDVRRGSGRGRERSDAEDVGRGAGARGEGITATPGSEAPTQVISEEDARLTRLERLGTLHEKGVLSDAEFAAEKARLLRD